MLMLGDAMGLTRTGHSYVCYPWDVDKKVYPWSNPTAAIMLMFLFLMVVWSTNTRVVLSEFLYYRCFMVIPDLTGIRASGVKLEY